MSQPAPVYEAERVVDGDSALDLIHSRFPDLASTRLTSLGAGWDNTAYLTDDGLVFRFPRRAIAVRLLETETRVLPRIASALPLPVPVPIHAGTDDGTPPWPFAGYRMLPGRSACGLMLDDNARTRAAAPLGAFLRALHAIDPAATLAPLDEHSRTDFRRRRAGFISRLEELRDQGFIDDITPLARLLPDRTMPAGELALVHGDLYARHVLSDDEGAPTGIIDWGDAHVGARGLDLSIAWSFLPPSARSTFFDAYGEIDEPTRRLARARAVFSAVMVTWYGARVDDADLKREGSRALQLVLQD